MITGQCLCGKISYACPGEPLFQLVCCCSDCQRASGSSHVPVVGVARDLFRVKGSPRAFSCPGGSGKNAVRHFCPDCGSLLFGTPEADDRLVTIYAGSIDRDFEFKPTVVINTKSKMRWEIFAGGMTLFEGMPE